MGKDENNNEVINVSAELFGAVTGAGLGNVVAGPAGGIAGAAAGVLVEHIAQWVGKEIKSRLLSKTEEKKIGTLYEIAKVKINANLNTGKTLRQDNFIKKEKDDRSALEEVTEETFFAAQRESEEKKLPFLANLYANILFDNSIDKSMAFQLYRMAESITYRQLEIISTIVFMKAVAEDLGFSALRKTPYNTINHYKNVSIATDIFALYRMGIIQSSSAILDVAGITPDDLSVGGCGAMLYKLMELNNIPPSDSVFEILATILESQQSTDKLIELMINRQSTQ